jgi:hypothetical protein
MTLYDIPSNIIAKSEVDGRVKLSFINVVFYGGG